MARELSVSGQTSSRIIRWELCREEDIFPGYGPGSVDEVCASGLRHLRIVCQLRPGVIFLITSTASIYLDAFLSISVDEQEGTLLDYLDKYLTEPGNSVMRIKSDKKAVLFQRLLDGEKGEVRLLITK